MKKLLFLIAVFLILKHFLGGKEIKIETPNIELPKIEMQKFNLEIDTTVVCTRESCKDVTMEDRRKAAEEAKRIVDEIMK